MKTIKSTQIWLKNNKYINSKPANSTSELVSNYHNFDGLKSKELFGWKKKTNEHASMVNIFSGFAINQIRLKIVKA